MAAKIFDRFKVIDTDTHITEPADVWTSRVASKWGDLVPHVRKVEGRDLWFVGDEPAGGPGFYTMAGFDGSFPEVPLGYDDIPRASYDAKARLELMDQEGIHAMVLYPNFGGFGSGGFLRLKEPELMLECVRAYNDFLVDWCSEDPKRLVPVMATPFWDVAAAVKEIERCAARGHRAVLGASQPEAFGQPPVAHKHWDPIWAAAQDAGLSISFHIGGGDLSDLMNDPAEMGTKANFSKGGALAFLANQTCIANLIYGGVCHRFPKLDFVSVESGAGWLVGVIEALDWQWINGHVAKEHPEYDLIPSEYFRRQIYGSFWFENKGLRGALDAFPDNLMWETDYPHPTCQFPGPATSAQRPSEYAEWALGDVDDATLRKVLQDTPARIYGLEV